MTTRTMTAMMVVAMTMASGCGDDGDAGASSSSETTAAASTTGSETPTTGADTTTADPTTGDDTTGDATTGSAALTPADLVGKFKSTGCESYPNGMGGNNYLTRDFTLTETTWHLDLVLYGDDACTARLFTSAVDGPYTLLDVSTKVPGATEGNFGFEKIVWTAHMQNMADTFTMSGCGAGAWEVEIPQDVTATGCIGVAHPVAECPIDHDVVSLSGDSLFFGERVTDMCEEEGRPLALGAYPVVRM